MRRVVCACAEGTSARAERTQPGERCCAAPGARKGVSASPSAAPVACAAVAALQQHEAESALPCAAAPAKGEARLYACSSAKLALSSAAALVPAAASALSSACGHRMEHERVCDACRTAAARQASTRLEHQGGRVARRGARDNLKRVARLRSSRSEQRERTSLARGSACPRAAHQRGGVLRGQRVQRVHRSHEAQRQRAKERRRSHRAAVLRWQGKWKTSWRSSRMRGFAAVCSAGRRVRGV